MRLVFCAMCFVPFHTRHKCQEVCGYGCQLRWRAERQVLARVLQDQRRAETGNRSKAKPFAA